MSWILWLYHLVGGLSRYIGELQMDLEYSRQQGLNSNITNSKVNMFVNKEMAVISKFIFVIQFYLGVQMPKHIYM